MLYTSPMDLKRFKMDFEIWKKNPHHFCTIQKPWQKYYFGVGMDGNMLEILGACFFGLNNPILNRNLILNPCMLVRFLWLHSPMPEKILKAFFTSLRSNIIRMHGFNFKDVVKRTWEFTPKTSLPPKKSIQVERFDDSTWWRSRGIILQGGGFSWRIIPFRPFGPKKTQVLGPSTPRIMRSPQNIHGNHEWLYIYIYEYSPLQKASFHRWDTIHGTFIFTYTDGLFIWEM